jgi:hypothetical protein
VDGCVESVSEEAYVSWAECLKKLSLAQCKGEPRITFKHRWPTAKKPQKFLSSAIKALQGLLDQQPLRKPPSKSQPAPWSRKWFKRISFSSQVPGSGLSRSAQVAPLGEVPIRTQGVWGKIGRATKRLEEQLSPQQRRERAANALFLEWATPMYSDVDDPDQRCYAGRRRHSDDEVTIRLTDLALLLSKAGVSLPKKQGLPNLLALYHLLDRDSDGWITQFDFTFVILETILDSDEPANGPQVPQPRARGGPRGRGGKEAKRSGAQQGRK